MRITDAMCKVKNNFGLLFGAVVTNHHHTTDRLEKHMQHKVDKHGAPIDTVETVLPTSPCVLRRAVKR